jgi:hypothetical protein
MKTLRELTQKKIEDEKNLTVVIDCEHAYAILKVWLDNFWDEVRGEQMPSGLPESPRASVLLRCLVNIATYTQLICEQLNFVQEELTKDEVQSVGQSLQARMLHILNDILYRTRSSPSLQKDGPLQYSCDFDQASLRNMKGVVDELRTVTRT